MSKTTAILIFVFALYFSAKDIIPSIIVNYNYACYGLVDEDDSTEKGEKGKKDQKDKLNFSNSTPVVAIIIISKTGFFYFAERFFCTPNFVIDSPPPERV